MIEILKIDRRNFKKVTEIAAKLIREGKVLVCPTDTVYGLLCDATNEKAVEKIFEIKKRPREKPIPIFVKDIKMAKKYAEIDKKQKKFLQKVWPGKITVVLKRKGNLPQILFGREETIGFRIPKYKLINELLEKINRPLTGTSANISGKPASTKLRKILKQFEKENAKPKPDLVLDAGNLKKAKPSTVIDLTEPKPKIIRKGQVKQSEIMRVFEKT